MVLGAFLESGDFNKEWFVKFRPSEVRYVLQKPTRVSSLNMSLGTQGCFKFDKKKKMKYEEAV